MRDTPPFVSGTPILLECTLYPVYIRAQWRQTTAGHQVDEEQYEGSDHNGG